MSTAMRSLTVSLLLCCGASPVFAQTADVAKFFAGAALGLGLHETAHLVADVAFGTPPGVRKVSAGFIPFFAITHEAVGPVAEFTISSAGFWIQHAGSEVLLSRRANLHDEHAPVAKGLLAFNVFTSMMYAGAAFARRGPPERDTRGIALSAGIAEPWIGATVLAPAVLDAARYYRPHSRALRWTSRGAKIGGAMLILKAAGGRTRPAGATR
jgi:hypothetical protein